MISIYYRGETKSTRADPYILLKWKFTLFHYKQGCFTIWNQQNTKKPPHNVTLSNLHILLRKNKINTSWPLHTTERRGFLFLPVTHTRLFYSLKSTLLSGQNFFSTLSMLKLTPTVRSFSLFLSLSFSCPTTVLLSGSHATKNERRHLRKSTTASRLKVQSTKKTHINKRLM